MTVFTGVDNADHGGHQLEQIGNTADLLQNPGMLKFSFQRRKIGARAGEFATPGRRHRAVRRG